MTLLETRYAPALPTADALVEAAVRALIEEALLTPKPALVDRRGSGVHNDMTLGLMLRSALSLRGTFRQLAAEGRRGGSDQRLRTALARTGRAGEKAMMAETGGVNTHRGAIWAIGLAVAAAASLPGAPVDTLVDKIARITAHDDDAHDDDARTPTTGSFIRQRYGVGGAVAQAQAGFPQATNALHALHASRARGNDETTARVDALLTSMVHLDDTCLLGRGGAEAIRFAQAAAATVLALGGLATTAGSAAFDRLDAGLSSRGASPGGSADMLALALFFDSLSPAHPSNQDH
jgi:triphosphoribosyl-dephospho-CoA synthase